MGALVQSDLGLRHSIRSRVITNLRLLFKKYRHTCATCSELPCNIITMGTTESRATLRPTWKFDLLQSWRSVIQLCSHFSQFKGFSWNTPDIGGYLMASLRIFCPSVCRIYIPSRGKGLKSFIWKLGMHKNRIKTKNIREYLS